MFHVVASAAFVDDHFVADCGDGVCACKTANFVKHDFGGRFCIAEHGDFDEFVQFKSKTDVFHLVFADAVFADLEYGCYVLRHTAKMCALS